MENINYLPGGILIFFGFSILFLNLVRQISNFKNRNNKKYKWSSPVPLIGPGLCIIGYQLLPLLFNSIVFFVFLIDADTLLILASIPALLLQRWNNKSR